VNAGDRIELKVTPDPYLTVRYAGASGDFNPIHIDEDFMGRLGEEIVVSGTVEEVEDGVATVHSEAVQAGNRIIRNAVAKLSV
jgi:hypothetical protein